MASTLVAEVAPARRRGRMLVLLESFWAYGRILAAVIGYLIVPDYGWRIAFLIGALPALYVMVLRRSLSESPRYLLRQGRVDEAHEAAASLGVELGDRADDEKRSGKPGDVRPASGLGALWAGGYARRTTMLWVLWFGMVFSYYGIFTWLPQILVTAGYEVASSFDFVLLITLAQIPGYFSAAYLVEKWGRKPTLVSYLLGSAAAALLFGLRGLGADASGAEILLWGSLVSFFNLGAWGVVYTYTPELYPTATRGTGAGSAAAFGRLGAIIGPYLVPWLLDRQGWTQGAIFAMFMVTFLVVVVAVALLGEETRGKALEQLAAEPGGAVGVREPARGAAD